MALAPPALPNTSPPDQVFPLGSFPLACGETLREGWLHYREYGTPNRDRSNLVLMPSSYGAWPEDLDWVFGPLFDPERHWLVLVSQFGNGRSSSPSNGGPPLGAGGWPVDHRDNLRAQVRLLEERFRVERPAMVYGWSMGAQQAYHWAVLEPDRPRSLCCVCGTARTTPHNRLFLLSLRRALTSDPAWDGVSFRAEPRQGLEHFALIYASWAASQAYYRADLHRQLGYASVEEYVQQVWLPSYRRHDPRDLIAMLDVWLANDVAAAAGLGLDLAAALGRIRAACAVVAGSQDLYFTPQDCAAEAALIPGAELVVLDSPLGHRAGNPRQDRPEQTVLRQTLERLWMR